jgi:hypothetical protein
MQRARQKIDDWCSQRNELRADEFLVLWRIATIHGGDFENLTGSAPLKDTWVDETFRHVVEDLIWKSLTQVLTRIVGHGPGVLGLDLSFFCVNGVVLHGQACFLISCNIFLSCGWNVVVVDNHRVSRLAVAHDGLDGTVRLDQLGPVRGIEDGVGWEERCAGEYAGVQEDVV